LSSVATVAVCIATYRRTAEVRRLIDSLHLLELPSRAQPPTIHVIVVDNDPNGSALTELAEVSTLPPVPGGGGIHLVHEPVRGIPQARNAGLRTARELEATLIAFLDDDEVVTTSWLDELLQVQHRHDADVVAGPVLPRFEGDPPDWLTAGGFFERARAATGADLGAAMRRGGLRVALLRRLSRRGLVPTPSTNNALVTRTAMDALGEFDTRLALAGGSDRELFQRAADRGLSIVWADEAAVMEEVPPHRQRVGWLLRRAFRLGNNMPLLHSLSRVSLGHSVMRRAEVAAFALLAVGSGSVQAISGLLRGRHVVVRGLCQMARGLGAGAGLVGYVYEEYR
jgi:succinoglycan biosynthesis protein ExoM